MLSIFLHLNLIILYILIKSVADIWKVPNKVDNIVGYIPSQSFPNLTRLITTSICFGNNNYGCMSMTR